MIGNIKINKKFSEEYKEESTVKTPYFESPSFEYPGFLEVHLKPQQKPTVLYLKYGYFGSG